MEPINKALQQSVWQRVQTPTQETIHPIAPSPEGLLMEELTDLAQLRVLGSDGTLGTLSKQARSRADVLQGICRLSHIPLPDRAPKAAAPENREAALTRCMSRLLRREHIYNQLRSHEEFGSLYGLLAEACGESALILCKYIGTALLHNRKR